MSDAKYFTRGKVEEFRAELAEDKRDTKFNKKRSTLKRIVANMTFGSDMLPLFPDVMNCMQIPDLEIKKMVYLYMVNYAKSRPDLVLMAVNSFMKDAVDSNPLIRALAIRTMSYIQVDRINESLCSPLRQCLKDRDPYVRKTAALAVVKLYFNDRDLVLNEGLLDGLKELMVDSNPTVVANALSALIEIHDKSEDFKLSIDYNAASNLCTALNECSEWGQVHILEAILFYLPENRSDAESIVERITPRLQHANAGVLLATVKVLMHLLNFVADEEFQGTVYRKMGPPLVTLLSGTPEIQYVALRNITLMIQKRPDLLRSELKVFFCKYNDPIYVKLSKLEIIYRLVQDSNVAMVLAELKEYALEVDVDFVRKVVRTIGRTAIRIQSAADKCIETLVELIQTKVNYVVQEGIVVIRDIFRRFPNQYESVIGTLCENLDSLDEPEAKSAMVWIVGQYADRIENSAELLESLMETFLDETPQVQLSILTATVKLFIKRPTEGKDLLPKMLKWATEETNDPDVRDRGYIYWRLLSTDPVAAKTIVLSEKPQISVDTDNLDAYLIDELLLNVGTVASIFHKPPRMLIANYKPRFRNVAKQLPAAMTSKPVPAIPANEAAIPSFNAYSNEISNVRANVKVAPVQQNLLDLDMDAPKSPVQNQAPALAGAATNQLAVQMNQLNVKSSSAHDLLSLGLGQPTVAGTLVTPKQLLLPANSGRGMEISGRFARRQGTPVLDLTITNKAMQPMTEFAIQFNKSTFGVIPAAPINIQSALLPNASTEASVPLTVGSAAHIQPCTPLNNLHVAMKNNIALSFFHALLPLYTLFREDGQLPQAEFLKYWKDVPEANHSKVIVDGLAFSGMDVIKAKLTANNVFTVADRVVNTTAMLYCTAKISDSCPLTLEIQATTVPQISACSVLVKCPVPGISVLCTESITTILRSK